MRNRRTSSPGALRCLVIAQGLFACVAGAAEISPAPAGTFSVVALPDTQLYSAEQPEVFYAEMQWILDNLKTQRIAFVSHLGDIVDKDVPKQWAVAKRAVAMLDGKACYGLCVGNHDMKCTKGDASLFVANFPAKRFAGRPWYVAQIKDNVNSAQTFEAEGLRFVILHVECNAPDDVLKWADGVLEAHKDRRAIISTHMFLGPLERPKTKEGWHKDPKGVMRWHKCHGQAGNSSAQLWEKCFSKHRNVFLILCGDQSRTQTMHVELTGKHGNRVHACLSDYREGYLRVYRFEPSRDKIGVMTYSVTKRALCPGTTTVEDASKHQFVLGYSMAARAAK
ncbi:MAG: metallophosphoesterase [Phycisphaerae bacterium]|nr:metallophosphoesterase [Phycisphaerae bacterium]